MSIFSSRLTYGDFRRTGEQDCGNAISYDDFDFTAGTPKQIVDQAWTEWEEDGMEEQWLSQQDPDEWDELDPHKCYEAWKDGWKSCAVVAIKRAMDDRDYDRENPPPKWWRKPAPTKDRTCYRTKIEALRKFLEVNYRIVENYGGADYKVSPSEFDSINHKYDLTGKKAARTIAEAVWVAMPVGRPYCLDRIDLDALNDTSPAREAGVAFVLPDFVYVSEMAEEEARHYAAQEPERIFPPVPQIPEGPMRLHLEHRHGGERGVERYQMLPPLPPQPEVKPMRVELEDQEPGVSTFRFGNPARTPRMTKMIENPAWVTKLLSKHFVKLEEHIPPKWLPKLTSPSTKQGKFVAAMKEYGCGAYGCVLPTLDPGVVLKVTTDETEAQFAHDMADKLAAPVVVKYHLTYSLPDQYKGLQTYLLWRDSAEHVDKVEQTIAEESGVDPRVVEKAIAGQHEAAQNAFEALDAGKPAGALLKTWEKKTREMGKAVPELRELAEGMITNLHTNKVFFGDVHGGNIGLVNGKWVVVDPGHVAVLEG